MRRAAKIDANQPAIVKLFRKLGCSVQSLAAVGKGVPDLLLGIPGRGNYLVEVKDGSLAPSRRKLTADQIDWHANWGGQVTVIHSEQDAEEWLNGIRRAGM